jgi:hypothetical protein
VSRNPKFPLRSVGQSFRPAAFFFSILFLIGATLVWCLGRVTPRVLYISPSFVRTQEEIPWGSWYSDFPSETWRSMQSWGRVLQDGGLTDWWAGGVQADHGEVVVATGPEGFAIAGCYVPSGQRKYAGYMTTWFFLPHWVSVAVVPLVPFGMYQLVVRTQLRLRRRFFTRRGRCGECGYDLTGNLSGKCSECGTRIIGARIV